MLQERSARLSRIVEQRRLKRKLEQDVRAVEEEFHDKSTRLESLIVRLEKEKVDVEKLERTSLTALFYMALGSREQQLEKERQELLSAQLQYQQTKHQVGSLEQERNNLLRQLDLLRDIESEYESILSEKEQFLRQSNQIVTGELMELSEQMANLSSEEREIDEAVIAANDVVSSLDGVIESLENAEGWGVWDMLGGGLISTMVKHSKIDEARDGINDVQTKISRFKRELADVQKNVDIRIDIGGFESFADFFFDGLIFDWIVQSKIEDSLERSRQAKELMTQVVKELERQKEVVQGKAVDIQKKKVSLIERA